MILLDACTSMCTALSTTLGPVFTEVFAFVVLGALGWWRARKAIDKVAVRAEAAEAKAADAHQALAEIRSSLRPVAAVGYVGPLGTPSPPPVLGTSSSQSGNFEPVTFPNIPDGAPRPRPSMPNPNLTGEEPLPRPSSLPDLESETSRETPGAKRRSP